MTVTEYRRRYVLGEEPRNEYQLQKAVSEYLEKRWPNVEYRIDLAGNNLSKAQAGKAKAVNKRRGWHDVEIYNPSGLYYGLCIELKQHGTRLRMKNDSKTYQIIGHKKTKFGKIAIRESKKRKAGDWADIHIEEQADNIKRMRKLRRAAGFGVGLKKTLMIIDGYLTENFVLMQEGFKID